MSLGPREACLFLFLVSTLVLFFGGEMTEKYIKSKEELEDCLRLEACVYVSDRNCTSRSVLRTIRDG